MTILRSGYGQTDRPTDIATYRAAIAAKILTWITAFYYYTTLVM